MNEVGTAHRLPIHDPLYRYPTSRNPYWTKLRSFEGLVYGDNSGEILRGKWRSQFKGGDAGTKLSLEIGCNGGHTLLEWARRSPNENFIGIDWKFKPIFRAAEKSQEMGLTNLKLLRGHAIRLPSLFADEELDAIYLYFPDPWAKTSQTKNRFVTAQQLKTLWSVLKPGGIFHIKTDHKEYFAWMLEAYNETLSLWKELQKTHDLHLGNPNPQALDFPEVTLFEKIFIRKKLPIHSLMLEKRI